MIEKSLSHAEVVQEVEKVLESNVEFYRDVRIKCMLIKDGKEVHNAFTSILTVPKTYPREEESQKSLEYDKYENVLLLEDWIKPSALLELINTIAENKLEISGERIPTNTWQKNGNFISYQFQPSKNDYFDYPGHNFITTSSQVSLHGKPLIDFKLPFFSDSFDAFSKWSGLKRFYGSNDLHVGKVWLFLPQCKARFEAFTLKTGKLEIKIGNDTGSILKVKGQVEAGRKIEIDQEIERNETTIEIPEGTKRIEIYLIGPDNTLYDLRDEYAFSSYTLSHERILTPSYGELRSADVQKALASGENETVECKPFIKRGDQKFNELIETVIAFANTKGGTIFIGIDDKLNVIGIERDINKIARGKNYESVLKDYIGETKQAILGSLNKTLSIDIRPQNFGSSTVLTISVPKGEEGPYSNLKTKEIFIRRGSNNVRPDPDTEIPRLYQKSYV